MRQIGVQIEYTGGPSRNVRITDQDGKPVEGVVQIGFEWDTSTVPEVMLWIMPMKLHFIGMATVHGRCPHCGEDLPVK